MHPPEDQLIPIAEETGIDPETVDRGAGTGAQVAQGKQTRGVGPDFGVPGGDFSVIHHDVITLGTPEGDGTLEGYDNLAPVFKRKNKRGHRNDDAI